MRPWRDLLEKVYSEKLFEYHMERAMPRVQAELPHLGAKLLLFWYITKNN